MTMAPDAHEDTRSNGNGGAGYLPAVNGSTDGNIFARAVLGVRNLASAWCQPPQPMFDFTDDYFTEFPVTPCRPSHDSWHEHDMRKDLDFLQLTQMAPPYHEALPGPARGPFSAPRMAMLLLAWPDLWTTLHSISNPFSNLPGTFQADACTMLCIPGAAAELIPQRRISWVPKRDITLAVLPGSGNVKFGVVPQARSLPSAPGASTFLGDAATWNDAVVSRLAREQLKDFMGALPPEEWQTYLKLRTDIRTLSHTISSDFQNRVKTWEDACVAEINKAIDAAIGPQPDGPLDCRTGWLHTDYYVVHSRSPRALADGQLVQKRHSVRLWESARQGFSYAVAWNFGAGRDFASASYISRDQAGHSRIPALSTSRFADIARKVDPGARAQQLVEELLEPGSLASGRLHDLHVNTLVFDILDASRLPGATGVDAAARARLRNATLLTQGNNDWRRYRAEFGITVPELGVGQWVQLPFFTYNVDGVGVVAHAMGRPDQPMRVFSDLAQAEKWLGTTADLTAPWLQAQLSGDDRERAVELLKSLAQAGAPLPGLNPVAALLRDTVLAILPKPAVTVVVDSRAPRRLPGPGGSHDSSPWKLSFPGLEFAYSRMKANAARLATPSGELDWTYATQAGLGLISEILELLVTPVPGGLAGLNRMRAIAFGGLIGIGVTKGGLRASQGDASHIVGSAVDILDLAFGLYSGRAAAMAKLRQAGYRRVPLGSGTATDGLWRFDVDAMIRPEASVVNGQQPSNDGIIHVLGKSFVRLELSSGTTAVLAASRGADGTWRLSPSNALDYAPAIERSGSHWILRLDDTCSVDDTALLLRSFSMAGLRGLRGSTTRLQDMTGVTRAELDRIWDGEPSPSWFDGAATRVAIGDILNRMLSTFPGHNEPLHAIGEAFYIQFLADTLGQAVRVVDDNGVTAYRLEPRTGPRPNGDPFSLHRQAGGFYGASRQAPRGERVGIPGVLDVVLAEQPALGSSHAPSAGVATPEARRRLVNKASDAWVRRHAREMTRACLWAFDLETPRQANDFLAAGRVAAGGNRLRTRDTRVDATVANLQYRYPGLTGADTLAVLADQTLGPLARGEPDKDGLADALGNLSMFSRVMAARFRALSGLYDADSEALLLTGLTSHPAWPRDRSIAVMQGGVDPETGTPSAMACRWRGLAAEASH